MIKMPNFTNTMMFDNDIETMTEIFDSTTESVPPEDQDMVFNDGHRLKIIVYR